VLFRVVERLGESARVPARVRVVLLGICVAVVFACAAPAAPAARRTTTVCATAGIVVWLDNQAGGAAAGSTYFKLEFTNLSGRACTLRGYPGVSAIDLRGRQLGRAAGRNPTRPSSRVTLMPGASAAAVLQIADVHNYPAATCHRTTAAGLRVYPPNQTHSKAVPFPFLACSRAGPTYLHIAPVQRA
jgi:hypothetical protein